MTTSQMAVMLCGWKGNRSAVGKAGLAVRNGSLPPGRVDDL